MVLFRCGQINSDLKHTRLFYYGDVTKRNSLKVPMTPKFLLHDVKEYLKL